MGDVVSFKKAKANKLKNKSSTLCANGHHAWEICHEKRFDVKSGKLVTVFRCKRCGKEKVKAL